jgi:hypothetical protein
VNNLAFKKACNRVIQPDKVKDAAYIMLNFALRWRRDRYTPFIVVFGLGTRKGYHRGIRAKREIHYIIDYFKLKGMNLKNIVGIDADPEICKQWNGSGITVINGNWFDEELFHKTRRYIRALARTQNKSPKISIYANTFGGYDDYTQYPKMIDILRPHQFIGLYNHRKRSVGGILGAENIEGYSPEDLGIMHNSERKGVIVHDGQFLRILRRIKPIKEI